jgi:hypothetical protein
MIETFSNLLLCTTEPEQRKRTPYRYIVTDDTFAHTAFYTRAGLLLWLSERGLLLTSTLPPDDTWSVQRIIGTYRREMHWSRDDDGVDAALAFDALAPVLVTRALSNGEYVVAKVTRDADGLRTVHTLNPNVRVRVTFDYWESKALMDGDRTVAP